MFINSRSLIVKLLLALASTAVLGSESHGTHDLILLFDGSFMQPESQTESELLYDWRFTAN
jgi:hypothetical protein